MSDLPIPFFADFTILDFEIWVLVLVRVSILVFLLPLIGASTVFPIIKIGLSVFLSFLIFNTLPEFTLVLPDSVFGFFIMACKEVLVGLVMGFAASILFLSVELCGRIIDFYTGFAMAQSINPLTETEESVMGQIQTAIISALLLVTHGHLVFIEILAESFQIIPPTHAVFSFSTISVVMISLVTQAFVMGIQIAMPMLVPLLLATTGLGIMARIMPQMNVWLVGMPLKTALGTFTLIFVLPSMWYVFGKHVDDISVHIMGLARSMGGATLGM
jgi:flagellar biosynthesis protein FliR